MDGNQQKWVSKLLGYHFVIQYKEGKENKAADALKSLAEETAANLDLAKIIQDLTINQVAHSGYSFAQGCLWRQTGVTF